MSLTIAIVGAGYSGLALTAHLHEFATENIQIYLIDPAKKFGVGIAYATEDASHLLNVRAKDMSAFADQPMHFVEWLKKNYHLPNPEDAFLQRKVYGLYLQSLFNHLTTHTKKNVQITCIQQTATALNIAPSNKLKLQLDNQQTLIIDKLVLATGHLTPTLPFQGVQSIQVITNPWHPNIYKNIAKTDSITIIGSGLTMIDTLLSLKAQTHQAPIHVISRRGRLPQTHTNIAAVWQKDLASFPTNLLKLLDYLRKEIKHGTHWQAIFNKLRTNTTDIWLKLPATEKKQFLRHVLPYWDTHRHRIAPEIATYIEKLQTDKKLSVIAGKIIAAKAGHVTVKPRHQENHVNIQTDWLINCTGPNTYRSDTDNPLINSLVKQHLAVIDDYSLGLKVTTQGALINATGAAATNIFALGPPCKGTFWECIAVPDIRQYSQQLAQQILS